MAFTTSVLLIPGQKYDTLTSSDSGFFYGVAREIDASDGMVERYSLSHAPTGKEVGLVHQGQPLILVILYRGLHAVDPGIELMDVARYWSPFFFAITLIPIFLIGRELAGDWGGCASAFFMSVLGSSIYWAKIGSFDREIIQMFFGVWTIFLVIRMFKARGWVSLKFGILTGLVYGLFGLSWGPGFLYLSPIIVVGLILVLIYDFLKRLFGGSEGSFERKIWAAILANKFLISSIAVAFGTVILVMVGLGGESPLFWTGFVQMVLGYVGIGGGGGATWNSTYASEMVKPGDLSKTFSKFYTSDFLTYIILILLVLALFKILWSRKRWELFVFPWLLVLVALVWPGAGQARFERLWWPMVPILAGVGIVTLIYLFRRFSFEPAMQDWVEPLHKPVLFAFCGALLMTPFIQNAYAIADRTTPPTEWHGRGLDEGFMEAFDWLDNTPENTVVSIQWSFGHLLTGALGRPTVTDGAETTAEVGTWENEEGVIKPPDYIYVVRNNTRYIYGLDISAVRYGVNGRRIDVARLPTMDENEFQWLVSTYRDNYNCKIGYMIFSYDEYYSAQRSFERRYQEEIANKLWEAETLASIESPHLWRLEDNNWVFDFGENRENIVLDQGAQNVYLRTDGAREYLDSYALLVVDSGGDLLGYGAYYPYSKPDIQETFVINITQEGSIVSARLIESASQLIATIEVPISLGIAVFDPRYWSLIPEYLEVAFTSSNGLVKVIKVYHSPRLVSPADGGFESDNTPTFSWASSVGGVKYELAVDNDADFSSPEVLEGTENLAYTPAAFLADDNYFWRVRAFNADNRSLGWSSSQTFTIDTQPPSASALSLPEDDGVVDTSTPTFKWSRPESGGSYTLAIDNDPSFSSLALAKFGLSDNIYTLTKGEALANGRYYWRVRFMDRAGNSGPWSENFALTVHAPPGRPTLLLPADNTTDNDSTPYFKWVGGLSAENYRLLVDNENTFSLPFAEDVLLGATADNWTKPDPGYTDGNYWWKVITINLFGENESSVRTFTIDTQPPGEPALNAPGDNTTIDDNTPALEWTVGVGADNHRLLVDNDVDFSSPEVNVLFGATDNIYTVLDENPLLDDSYYWKVIAIDRAGNENESSIWTFTVSV
jgi:hypothetical protein